MVRVLSDADVAAVLSLSDLLPVVEDAVRAQDAGRVERPPRPHFPVGTDANGSDPAGTALTMPAYVHGRDVYATKLASVHPENPERGRDTVNAQIAVTDAETGEPLAYLAGNRITNARTGCVGALAVRSLTEGSVTLGLIGAGAQARWQARAADAAVDLDAVRVYSPSVSRERCAADLRDDLDCSVTAVDTPETAVRDADAVVTATTATEPVVAHDALPDDVLVVAVGAYTSEMQELDPATLRAAAGVWADVPEEVAETGDALAADLDAADLRPLTDALDHPVRDGVRVALSVGSAVFDAATAERVYRDATERGIGDETTL
ncbi:ornithine cyclodeaminase family protein [Halocalculus aciditolerans]|uniref:Delta(1)-pyrroline-2-carboxylate reductase n=1 Tax=Halocalculus aciditolerans TaxID=1383812 RepID=A0A830FCG9_9EURY|nr:ornithine cyclodeaminase family protein [Halocalculus aciditolerans]GGL60803.1 delta(1)-pyrroline-2-carboxylate reductase [Halocalculus aciditolerans]